MESRKRSGFNASGHGPPFRDYAMEGVGIAPPPGIAGFPLVPRA